MISNDIAPTIDGIYKAEMSVAGLPQNSGYQISFQEFNAMRPQIESLIGKSGLAVNLQNLNNAQELINNNIPVTEKRLNIRLCWTRLILLDFQMLMDRAGFLTR